jgi:V/A-type H+-transporting ATPase subunit I
VTEHFAWITGWTSDCSGCRIEAVLRSAGLHGLLRVHDPPQDLVPPVVLRNPRWAQPFELFERLLGVPATREADPSAILALVAPAMFGFMFGDVGQAALLVLAGAMLRRKYPALKLLVPGGIEAMLFGFLFGSVFAREDLLPALWLRPLQEPLTLLRVSVSFGAGVILMGFWLDALQHYWAGRAPLWWSARGGLVLSYLGMVGALLDSRALWAVPAGLAWNSFGRSVRAPSGRLKELAAGIGESLQTLLQLLVNTISFVRMGAFALAHAGLAATITGLAAGTDSRLVRGLVLVVGNLVVITIEGLIVGIQTTRLVLFEFFIRFLRGSGRLFRPLPKPPTLTGMPALPHVPPPSI